MPTPLLGLLGLLGLLVACPPPTDDGDGGDGGGRDAGPEELECDGGCWPRRCARVDYFEGDAEGELEVGTRQDGVFVPWVDGGDAVYTFGFQGGSMIQPVIRLPAELAGDGCVRIETRHSRDPAYPDAPEDELDSFARATFYDIFAPAGDGFITAGPLDDQIGWRAPDGVHLILTITASTTTWTRTRTLHLRVVDEDGFQECDLVPGQGLTGCTYRVFEGVATVESIDRLDGATCDDRLPVHYQFAANDADHAECIDETRTETTDLRHSVEISLGCIRQYGLDVGETFGMQWRLASTDRCPPFEAWPEITRGGCPCD